VNKIIFSIYFRYKLKESVFIRRKTVRKDVRKLALHGLYYIIVVLASREAN
jgi:hypothetical protein